jgi:SAM-dependent methyltransferase
MGILYYKNKLKHMATPSQFDNETFLLARNHINDFIKRTAIDLPNTTNTGKLLEIGPQTQSTVREYFNGYKIDTFDIVSTYNPTFVGDITKYNKHIPDDSYDVIACLEVLEHTLNPFDAVKELRRLLKHEGYILLSAPLNWRIHGPVPDCWRFTEHGWKALLRDFDIINIDILETPDRELFPIKYNILARCNKYKNTSDDELNFRYI